MAEPGIADGELACDRTIHRDVVYAGVSGFRPLLLDLVVPTIPAAAPVVLYLHGGGFAVGTHKIARNQLGQQVTDALITRGVAVASVQYRLSGEARFPAPVHDVKAALRWLKRHAEHLDVDPHRTGAWGDSAGGYLAAMLAVTAGHPELDGDVGVTGEDNRIRAGVSWYGPSNLATQPRLGPPALENTDPARSPEARLLGAPVEEVGELAAFASPVSHVSPAAAPMLLVHGEEDDGVPIGQSEELVASYQAVRAPISLVRVANAGHGFPEPIREPLLQASVDFLVKHLT